jgi:hypothetical protein
MMTAGQVLRRRFWRFKKIQNHKEICLAELLRNWVRKAVYSSESPELIKTERKTLE